MRLHHLPELLILLAVNGNALLHIGQSQNFFRAHGAAALHQLLHQLIVGNREVTPSAEACAGIHKKAHQNPAFGILNLVYGQVAGIHLVHSHHHVVKMGKPLLSAVIFVNNTRAGRRDPALAFILPLKLVALVLAGMMVKPETAPLYKGNVCQHIVLVNLHKSVLQILWMRKFPTVNQADFL